MPPFTTARFLLGLFPLGADPLSTNQHATALPIRLTASSSLRAVLATEARGRGTRGGASGCKGPREEGGRSAGEGGRNGDGKGRPCSETETGMRMTAARRRRTSEQECGGREKDYREQIIIDRDGI